MMTNTAAWNYHDSRLGSAFSNRFFFRLKWTTGWWFGCHQFYLPINIGLLIIAIDELHHFSEGWLKTTNQKLLWFWQSLLPTHHRHHPNFRVIPSVAGARSDCRLWIGRPLLCSLTCPKIDVFPQIVWLEKGHLFFSKPTHLSTYCFRFVPKDDGHFRSWDTAMTLPSVWSSSERTTAKATAHATRDDTLRFAWCGAIRGLWPCSNPFSTAQKERCSRVPCLYHSCTQMFWGCGWCCNLSYPAGNQTLQVNIPYKWRF